MGAEREAQAGGVPGGAPPWEGGGSVGANWAPLISWEGLFFQGGGPGGFPPRGIGARGALS